MFKFILSCSLLTASAMASADTTLNFSSPQGPMSTEITAHFVRMQIQPAVWALYDKGEDAISIINDRRREVTVIDPSSIARIQEQMEAAQAELARAMENLDAEQREMMERMLGDKVKPEAYSPSLRDKGTSSTVAGLSCKQRVLSVQGKDKQDICVVEAEQLGLSAAEVAAVSGMFDMFSNMPVGPQQPSLAEFGGLPIDIVDSNTGRHEQTLSSVAHDDIPLDRFIVPAAYRTQRVDQ